jgi:hypothetical protein
MSSPQTPRDLNWYSCNNGNCVEVALLPDRVLLRVGRDYVSMTKQEWDGFRDGVKDGAFDAI